MVEYAYVSVSAKSRMCMHQATVWETSSTGRKNMGIDRSTRACICAVVLFQQESVHMNLISAYISVKIPCLFEARLCGAMNTSKYD